MTYLASMTKTAASVSQMMDLYETLGRESRGRFGGAGMMRRFAA